MDVNRLAQALGDACYVFLALNLLWGLFCAIWVWRQLTRLAFRPAREQTRFVDEISNCLSEQDFATAAGDCEDEERALPRLTGLALANRDLEASDLRQLVAEHLQRDVMAPLENRVNWILTVIRNGPLLGLFGTVLGMMAAFGRIGSGEKVEPAQIADEISIALICTAMGLGTAIPLGYVANSLTMRIRELQESLSHSLVRLLDRLQAAIVTNRQKGT